MDTKWAVGLVVVLILALAAVFFLRPKDDGAQQTGGNPERSLKTFYNEKYGIAFNYPDNLKAEEQDSTEGTAHHTIVVADAAALDNPPAAGEGPMSITIDIFPNPKNQTAEAWVKATEQSNFKLSPDKTLVNAAVAGEEAVAYGWDGLYRSNSIVFKHKTQIFMLSVGYDSPDDQLVKDFAKVVSSIQFDP